MQIRHTVKLASPGRRLLAWAIDILPVLLIGIILGVYFVHLLVGAVRDYSIGMYGMYGFMPQGSAGSRDSAATGAGMALFFGFLLLAYGCIQFYFFTKSQMVGKAVLGLQVISASDGRPAGLWRMLLRELLGKRASEVLFGLGFLWILIDGKRRGWHDKIMDTYVIDLRMTALIGTEEISHAETAVPEGSLPDEPEAAEDVPEETEDKPEVNVPEAAVQTETVRYNETEKYYSHKW